MHKLTWFGSPSLYKFIIFQKNCMFYDKMKSFLDIWIQFCREIQIFGKSDQPFFLHSTIANSMFFDCFVLFCESCARHSASELQF